MNTYVKICQLRLNSCWQPRGNRYTNHIKLGRSWVPHVHSHQQSIHTSSSSASNLKNNRKNKCKKAASHLQIFFMLKLSLHSNKVSFPVLSESPEGRAAGLHNACMTLCGVGYCLFSDSISPPGEPGRGTAYVPPITMPSEMHIQNPAARHNLPNHTE